MRPSLFASKSALAFATLSGLILGMACALEETQPPPDGTAGLGGGTSGGGSGQSGKGGTASATGGATSGTGGTSAGSTSKAGSGGTGTGGSSAGSSSGASGGTLGSGGNGASGGRAGAGGSAGSAAGSGGTGATGMGGSAGTPSAGAGGVASGGSAGTAMGGSGGAAPAEPSAGCGKAPGPTGSSGSPLTVAGHQYYIVLPTGYDNATPYRLLFAFHPSGNPISWAEQNTGFKQTDAARMAILVYPKSAGNGWEKVDIDMFDPLYTQLVNNFCVDQARVFAAGHSSGGDYASILGCEKADKVRAVGPVAAKPMSGVGLNPGSRTCSGKSTAYVIHGKNDSVVGADAGIQTRDFHLAKNNCGTMTTPVDGYTDTLSNCVEYQGCDEGYPVFWCQHTDPEYSNTNHGWPKFAGKFLWEQLVKY